MRKASKQVRSELRCKDDGGFKVGRGGIPIRGEACIEDGSIKQEA